MPVPGVKRREKATAGCSKLSVTNTMPRVGVEEGEEEGVVVGVAVRVAVAEAEAEPEEEEEGEAVRDFERVEEAESGGVKEAEPVTGGSALPVEEAVRDLVRVEEAESTAVMVPVAEAQAVAENTGVPLPPSAAPPPPPSVEDVLVVAELDAVTVMVVPAVSVEEGVAEAELEVEGEAEGEALSVRSSDTPAVGVARADWLGAIAVLDTVLLGDAESAAVTVARDRVAVDEDAPEKEEAPLGLPPPPPPCVGDSDTEADSVPVVAPEVEGRAMVMVSVEVTVSEGDRVIDTEEEGLMVREMGGEPDTEGEVDSEPVPGMLTVSVGVGDWEGETRGEPELEPEPELVFEAMEVALTEPVEDREGRPVMLCCGEPEGVLDAVREKGADTEVVAVAVREYVSVAVGEMDTEGVEAALVEARAEPVGAPVPVAAFEGEEVAVTEAVADCV